MNQQTVIQQIGQMSERQLLEHVITHPFHMTDSYYIDIRHAIIARAGELQKPVSTPWGFY